MPTNPETPPDAKFMLREPVRSILLADNLSACPPEVQAANTEAVSKWDAHQAAIVQLRHARTEQDLAAGLDRAADTAAIAAGKEMPAERAQQATSEAVQIAARREQAARSLARSTQLALAHCMHKNKTVWVADQGGVVTAAQDKCLDLLERLGVAYAALTRERVLLSGLQGFPLGDHLDYTRMGRYDAPVSAPLADLEALKEAISPTSSTPTRNSAPTSKRTLGQ
jgi:hypothetical protein